MARRGQSQAPEWADSRSSGFPTPPPPLLRHLHKNSVNCRGGCHGYHGLEKAFPAAPAARPAARSLRNLPNLWSFLDSTLLCSPGGMGPGFTI